MAERWQYAQGKHPAYCTCTQCVNSGRASKSNRSKPSLSDVLDRWQKRNFDPYHILGVAPNSSRKLIVEAHHRWIIAYHPDKHQNDPLATELTKRLNAARDELLGKGQRGSQYQRDQQRRHEEAQRQRAQEEERQRQEEEREQREREAEELAREAARIREEDQRRGIDEAEQLIRQAATRDEEDQPQRERGAKQPNRDEEERRQRARETQRRRQDEERRQRVNNAKQRKQEKAGRQSARKAAKRQTREEERRKRANKAEQLRRQEEARRQGVREAERLMGDGERRRQETANRRSTRSQYQQQSQRESYARGYDAHSALQNSSSHRKLPLRWVATSIVLVSIVIAYLILSVQTPAAVDSMMDEWAKLFDQALARNIGTTNG